MLDSYLTTYALFNSYIIPADCTAKKTINFYQLGSIDCRLEYGLGNYTVNCRAETQAESEAIANAVITAVNRRSYTTYYLFCQLNQCVPPADNTDVFNTPVEITIKKR
jgi:hypothetical protein